MFALSRTLRPGPCQEQPDQLKRAPTAYGPPDRRDDPDAVHVVERSTSHDLEFDACSFRFVASRAVYAEVLDGEIGMATDLVSSRTARVRATSTDACDRE